MQPLVSILLPAYNVESYLAEAINSIINQTYRNIELVVVDDCSTDDTYSVANYYASIDSRIRVFRNQVNLKICDTLNYALSVASGNYIARMDGDDISEIDRIERLVEYLECNKCFDLVGCSVIAIDTNGREIGRTIHYADMKFLVRSAKFVSPCSHIWVARRRVYEVLQGYRNMPGVEDYDFLLRAIDAGFKITNIEDYFGYKVRLGRIGNTTSTIGAKQRLLQDYTYSLHRERQMRGFDSHSDELMSMKIRQSKISIILFALSNYFLQHALRANGLIRFPLRICCLALSIVSPIQAKYLFTRLRYRLMRFGAKL